MGALIQDERRPVVRNRTAAPRSVGLVCNRRAGRVFGRRDCIRGPWMGETRERWHSADRLAFPDCRNNCDSACWRRTYGAAVLLESQGPGHLIQGLFGYGDPAGQTFPAAGDEEG